MLALFFGGGSTFTDLDEAINKYNMPNIVHNFQMALLTWVVNRWGCVAELCDVNSLLKKFSQIRKRSTRAEKDLNAVYISR